jgi:uncharacterized protein
LSEGCAPETAARLIAALREPRCYPHPVQRVEVRETHISWVVLTGEYAYKIKKPVRLEFLDFSTLARRRYYCEEELRLNRRFAPALYLDLARIHGPVERPQIDGVAAGPPIEFAVRMWQFEDSERLNRLLGESDAHGALLCRFGNDFARLQAGSTRLEPQTESYAANAIAIARRNADELRRLIGRPAGGCNADGGVDAVIATLLAEGARLRSAIAARSRDGFVRECHGDLHAGNVVRVDGRLVAFDCIEFDPGLRHIDVMNDIAFLYADLIARGHAASAFAFLDGWLEVSGDYAGLALLPWFAANRALVRAKVSLLSRAATAGGNGPACDGYLATARAELSQRQPVLITMMGLSGSGKSWLSRRLVEALPAIRVRSDVERRRLAGIGLTDSSASAPGEGIYTMEFNRRTYERLLDCARDALATGRSVIVDAACLRRHERAAFERLARAARTPWVNVSCVAPVTVLANRISARQAAGGDPSEADLAVLERQVRVLEPVAADEQNHTIAVDTSDDECVASTVRSIRRLAASAG